MNHKQPNRCHKARHLWTDRIHV